jgi:RNA 2',3'-cyclic 3'-phosphodiesterase
MRLFTAIDIDSDVREKLAALLDRLRPLAKLSWTTADRMHITTKFIGEWPEDRLEEIKVTLASVGSPGAIEIAIHDLGWFPNLRHPRVLWAGVAGGTPLSDLAHATEEAVFRLGVAREEREYSPHLTLARIRDANSLNKLRREVEALGEGVDFGSFIAPNFFLYLSQAGRYTKLAEFPLT